MAETIREFVKQDLFARLASGEAAARDLSIPALAKHYGVSFTPVRQALGELVSEGVLLKGDDGRVVASARAGRRARTGNHATTVPPDRGGRLEAALTQEVIRRSLRGETVYLREEATAERFGVGRTVLRHALGRLAGRGLVVHVPRCGWRVRSFDEADLDAYLEVRVVLELKALALARHRLAQADLKRMLAGNAADSKRPRLDNELHRYLVAKARNGYIRDFFDRHGAYYTALFDFAAPEARVVAAMARQHAAILRALIAQDWTAARHELARHIRSQGPIVKALLRRLGSPANGAAGESRDEPGRVCM